jgi:hypothetical protein
MIRLPKDVTKEGRAKDIPINHRLKGMDMHYIVPSDESLTKAMDRFTKCLDGELKLENVDQNVDQNLSKN